MSEADRLFLELGHELIPQVENRSYFLKYKKDDDNIIYFDEDKEIHKDGEYAETCYGITMQELKAINKKCEELNGLSKLIHDWKELSQVPPNDKYKIVVDDDMCCGWIRPVKETEETRNNWAEYNYYLSTHTFYGLNYQHSTEVLQRFGFDVELYNWDKGR